MFHNVKLNKWWNNIDWPRKLIEFSASKPSPDGTGSTCAPPPVERCCTCINLDFTFYQLSIIVVHSIFYVFFLYFIPIADPFYATTGARGTDSPPPPPFSNFLFTNLFSIKFLYFFIISSLFPYFNLFVSIFIQSYANIKFTPYNRLSGQQMISGTQIISTSHGMTGRNFFDVFLPFYLLFGF